MYKEFFAMIKKNAPNQSVIVDATVAAGKSSLCQILSEEFGLAQFEEPVVDNPILEKFYYDRKRYAFPLQIFFLNRRFKMLKEASAMNESCLMDRSIYGDVIFAKMLSEGGDMDKDEFSLYQELLCNMLDHIEAPKLMIYLKTDTETAVKRMKKRGRDYELATERSYWETLNKEYEAYFKEYNLSPLLVIDATKYDFVENPHHREIVVKMVRDKLREIEEQKKIV